MSCMSPYSIPLCTIFTKCPALPRADPVAARSSIGDLGGNGLKDGLDVRPGHRRFPPGMIEGPARAPSSPPETPVPMNRIPFSLRLRVRRVESGKCELPPSIRMSPGSKSGTSSPMTSSTGAPALTMIMILRGRLRLETSSCTACVPTIDLSLARPLKNASTLEVVRLNTATVKPWLAMLSTRFSPITARPMSPMSAVAAVWSWRRVLK